MPGDTDIAALVETEQFQGIPTWLKAYFATFAERDEEGISDYYVEGDVQYHVHKDAYLLLPAPLSCLRLCGCDGISDVTF